MARYKTFADLSTVTPDDLNYIQDEYSSYFGTYQNLGNFGTYWDQQYPDTQTTATGYYPLDLTGWGTAQRQILSPNLSTCYIDPAKFDTTRRSVFVKFITTIEAVKFTKVSTFTIALGRYSQQGLTSTVVSPGLDAYPFILKDSIQFAAAPSPVLMFSVSTDVKITKPGYFFMAYNLDNTELTSQGGAFVISSSLYLKNG